MSYLHPLVKLGQKGATAESNLRDMVVIRRLQEEVVEAQENLEEFKATHAPIVEKLVQLEENLVEEWAILEEFKAMHAPIVEKLVQLGVEVEKITDERDSCINKMVTDNVPLVRLKVESYIGLNPKTSFLRDDLFSVGMLALLVAVKTMAEETKPCKDNPNAYISQRIIWRLSDMIREDIEQSYIPENYTLPYPSEVDPRNIVETRDLLKSACLTEEDEVIIKMRENGCVDQEIADTMGISWQAVYLQRLEIEKRYNSLVRKSL